jgi:hypothetical protein
MLVLLLDLTFKSGMGLTSSCSAGLKPSLFFKMYDIQINFLLLFSYSTERNRIQLNFIQYECTCTFAHFWTTEDYQHTRYVQLRICVTTCLHIHCNHSSSFLLLLPSPKTPLSLRVPRNEIAFIVRESYVPW